MGVSKLQNQGGGTDWSQYTTVPINLRNYNTTAGNSFTDVYSINGEGILTQLQFFTEYSAHHITLLIDGVEKQLGLVEGTASTAVKSTGGYRTGTTSVANGVQTVIGPIAFKSQLVVRIKNLSPSPDSSNKILTGIVLIK